MEKYVDDRDHQEKSKGQGEPHLANRIFHKIGFVIIDDHFDPIRQGRTHQLELVANAMGNRNRVGLGLLDHSQKNTGLPIVACPCALVFHPFSGISDITQSHETVSILTDHQLVELGHGFEFSLCLDRHLTVPVFHPTTGELHILLGECPLHIQDGDLMGSHFFRVQPQANGKALFASNENGGNSFNGLEAILDLLLREIGHFKRRESIAAHPDPHDRARIGILLGNHGLIDVLRKATPDTGNAIPHILGCDIDVTGEIELDGDVADLFATLTGQGLDAGHIVDDFFQTLGDFGFDHRGVGSGVDGGNVDNGRINVREFADWQATQADGPKEHECQAHHGGQHRSLNAQFGKPHDRAYW